MRRKCEYGVFQITSRRRVIWKIPYSHFRSHSIHIVENYKNSWNCSKMTVFFMFTLCKMARKTHVHTLQWCFLKNSSNRRKVWTWVFLATLQSVNMKKLLYSFGIIVVFYNERILWGGNVSMVFSKSRVEDEWFGKSHTHISDLTVFTL